MALADHDISDKATFDAATSGDRNVAGVYFFKQLDPLIEIARQISIDFVKRPHLFVRTSVVKELTALYGRYGYNETFLSADQRTHVYEALFGPTSRGHDDNESSFHRLREELFRACATFVESKFMDEDSLRENVIQKHLQIRQYLVTLNGASTEWTRNILLENLSEEVSFKILRDEGISAVYGVRTAPTKEYPYAFDDHADILIEEVAARPEATESSGQMPLTRERIINRQRCAIEGARAIASILDYPATSDSNSLQDDTDALIRRCYTWRTALRAAQPNTEVSDSSTGVQPYPSE